MIEFERFESNVRAYCRAFPAVFRRSQGSLLWDEDGREYVDFFAGAGALNYGHNHPALKERLLEYLSDDGITHALDMATTAKRDFLVRFHELILEPRGLEYKVQFPGPTGTNAVEAALKLARKVTGRTTIMSFTNAFHGMTLGSLSVTGNRFKRRGGGLPLTNGTCVPYDGYFGKDGDTIEYMRALLEDEGSGIDTPAAVIVETIQGEGGIHVASYGWLRRLEQLCRRHDILLVVDDVQVGCGRTGPFFSFERAGIRPDVICLSKALSGYGLPMAITLLRPDLDVWEPAEHNGTFRGNNLAFVTATRSLELFWQDEALAREVARKGRIVRSFLEDLSSSESPVVAEVRGRGLIQGLDFDSNDIAQAVCRESFERGLLLETSGAHSDIVKITPPLVIDEATLAEGLDLLREAMRAVFARPWPSEARVPA